MGRGSRAGGRAVFSKKPLPRFFRPTRSGMLASLAAKADDHEFGRRKMRRAATDFSARASGNTRPIPLPRGRGRKASNESRPSRRDSKAGFPATTNRSLGNAVLKALSMGVAITASPKGLGRRIRVASAGGKGGFVRERSRAVYSRMPVVIPGPCESRPPGPEPLRWLRPRCHRWRDRRWGRRDLC